MAVTPKPKTQPLSVMAALQSAIAAAPDLSKEISAIKAAQTNYDLVRQKATEAHSHNYAADLNATHVAVVAAQARYDIGRATTEELAQAKASYAAAQEKADMAPGRRAVLLEELERSREAIQEAISALDDAAIGWEDKVDAAAREAEELALRLLVTASHALHMADPEREQVYAMQILSELPQYTEMFAGGGAVSIVSEAVEPEQIGYANIVRRRAARSLEYLPDGDRMSTSRAEAREAQLSPQAIEQARKDAFQKTEQARTAALLNANQPSPPGVRSAPYGQY